MCPPLVSELPFLHRRNLASCRFDDQTPCGWIDAKNGIGRLPFISPSKRLKPKLSLNMNDVLIPLGLLLFIGFFAFAIIHTARKQRKAKAEVYRDFAESNGVHYREQDDGRAQEFARNFDGIGQFRSPSLGKLIPKDVVYGTIDGAEIILFRHAIRLSEDFAREWFVAGVSCHEYIAKRCAVQFGTGGQQYGISGRACCERAEGRPL